MPCIGHKHKDRSDSVEQDTAEAGGTRYDSGAARSSAGLVIVKASGIWALFFTVSLGFGSTLDPQPDEESRSEAKDET